MEAILDSKEIGELMEFGLCGKELACHTCRVNILKGYDRIPNPTVDEEDVLDSLGSLNKEG